MARLIVTSARDRAQTAARAAAIAAGTMRAPAPTGQRASLWSDPALRWLAEHSGYEEAERRSQPHIGFPRPPAPRRRRHSRPVRKPRPPLPPRLVERQLLRALAPLLWLRASQQVWQREYIAAYKAVRAQLQPRTYEAVPPAARIDWRPVNPAWLEAFRIVHSNNLARIEQLLREGVPPQFK